MILCILCILVHLAAREAVAHALTVRARKWHVSRAILCRALLNRLGQQ